MTFEEFYAKMKKREEKTIIYLDCPSLGYYYTKSLKEIYEAVLSNKTTKAQEPIIAIRMLSSVAITSKNLWYNDT